MILFNNRIMQTGGPTELGVFGAVATTMLLVQCLFYGVGQALQPLASYEYGAGNVHGVKKLLKYALLTAAVMSAVFCILSLAIPEALIRVYISDLTDESLALGARAFRIYAITYCFMGINVTLGYYFQSVLRVGVSVLISLLRGLVLCSALLYPLTALFGVDAVWWVMPGAETLTAVVSFILLLKVRLARMAGQAATGLHSGEKYGIIPLWITPKRCTTALCRCSARREWRSCVLRG